METSRTNIYGEPQTHAGGRNPDVIPKSGALKQGEFREKGRQARGLDRSVEKPRKCLGGELKI